MKLIPNALERSFLGAVRPFVDGLIRARIRPNTITTVGTALVLLSAVAYGLGAVRAGGLVLLLSGITDTLDGAVARANGMVTKFGAFYDSTLDRVGDGATFMGIAVYLLTAPEGAVAWRIPAVIICMVAIIASLLVSYARARAEGLGLECKVGIAQRAERIVGLGVVSLVAGTGGRAMALEVTVAVLALASVITVVQRFVYVYQVTEGEPAQRSAGAPELAGPDSLRKGSSQW